MSAKEEVDPEAFEPAKLSRLAGAPRDPLGQLSPQPWMAWPQTKAVLAALTAGGAEVRFVGGCVRDALLHRPCKDIDIATPDTPDRVMALLAAAGIKVVATGLAHGTVTAVVGEGAEARTFEVTTLRRDVATDGRHAEVEWTTDWVADAARRDFTINAMSATPDGAVYDYFDGLAHLHHGRVVFVGRAQARIREDFLRILRFFRFHARYGRPPLDHEGLKACQMLADGLDGLSGERVRDELLKILETDAAPDVLLVMRGERILAHILPEAAEFGRLRQLVFLESRGVRLPGLEIDPLRRLGAVLAEGTDAAAVAARLKLSNAQAARLAGLLDGTVRPWPTLDTVERQGLLRRVGRDGLRDRALLLWAGQRALEGRTDSRLTAGWVALLEDAAALPIPEFPLRGRDLLALGAAPGPQVGALLAALEEEWEAGGYGADRDALLAQARDRLSGAAQL
ncbi:CCA tRNA nucleotidyltransferase [Novispirillum sp. DQ9]|uniref:CCA tRNA nucleotidyltransferase n=1 Tax=Novispirillum sp. DQ9 TaxID=3398612 RepID=UPI003C7CC575